MNKKPSHSLNGITLRKFKRNFWGVFSLGFLFILIFISAFAYFIIPDNSPNANQMHLAIHSKPPGFGVTMLLVPLDNKKQEKKWSHYFFGHPSSVSEIPIVSYSIKDSIVEYIEYHDNLTSENLITNKNQFYQKRVKEIPFNIFQVKDIEKFEDQYIVKRIFYFGTDKYGRDLLSRMIIGSRVSIAIGFVAVLISLIFGIFFGSLAGYYGGIVDAFIMWVINIIWSIPTLLLVIAMTLSLGKGFWQIFIAVGLTMWVEVARIVRGQVMSIKKMPYITAVKAMRFYDFRIIMRHILPNALGPIIIISAANFASAILIESGLSFLGLGVQLPTPSWGAMIKDHYSYIILGKSYLSIIPGLAIMFLVLAFMTIGNTLKDAIERT